MELRSLRTANAELELEEQELVEQPTPYDTVGLFKEVLDSRSVARAPSALEIFADSMDEPDLLEPEG